MRGGRSVTRGRRDGRTTCRVPHRSNGHAQTHNSGPTAYKGFGPSIENLAQILGRKECSICGRLDELRKIGCIINGPLKINPNSGKPAMTYIAMVYKEPDPQPLFPVTVDRHGQLDFAAALQFTCMRPADLFRRLQPYLNLRSNGLFYP